MNKPAWSVQKVKALPPYTLQIWFADGSVKLYDMAHNFSLPCYKTLTDWELFKLARPFAGAVIWNDEVDIDPRELYFNGINAE